MKGRRRNLPATLEERLEFVELLAYFHGTVRRDEIMNRFGISAASATNILSKYSQMAPENLTYNVHLKCYEISKSFEPVFNVRVLTERIPVYTIPQLHILTDNNTIEIIAVISRAIQRTQSLTITYSSASSGISSRQIVPVAFADNRLRWHLRAYDRKRERYADFVLKRILEAHPLENDTIQDHEHPKNDNQWHSFTDLRIKAHPHNLADTQSFTMGVETYNVRVRAAMAGYFLQLWNVDCSPDANLRGKEHQYVLSNMMEVAKFANLELAPGYIGENTESIRSEKSYGE